MRSAFLSVVAASGLVMLMAAGCTNEPKKPAKPAKPAEPAKPAQPTEAASKPADSPSQLAGEHGKSAGSQPASRPLEKDPTGSLNGTGIRYKDQRCSGVQPCDCVGSLIYGQNALAKIGISEQAIANGTPCVLGDFDGNGFTDLAFLEGKPTPKAAVRVQVLLFDKLGLRNTPALPKRVTSLGLMKRPEATGLFERESRYFFTFDEKKGAFAMKRI